MAENDHEAKKWTDLLARIRKRPGMYLGSPNLQALHMLISGFGMAEDIYAVPEERRKSVNDFPWQDFETFVCDRYNNRRLSLNSFGLAQYEVSDKNLATFDAAEEHPGAWELWWKWHDEFHRAQQQ